MNGAWVEGVVMSAAENRLIVSVTSHDPDRVVVFVPVDTARFRGLWGLVAGVKVGIGGRLVKRQGHLMIEATQAFIDGQEVTAYEMQ